MRRQALIGGGVAGVFEGLFEKFSLGNLQALKKTPITDAKKLLKSLAKTAFVNASEEAATEIANIAYDALFHGDISNYSLLLKEYTAAYVEQGMSETDAEKKARGDVIWTLTGQVLESMASGALIGAGFTGAGAMQSDYRTYIAGRAITESGAQAELYQQALAFPPGSATYQLAERLDGKEMSEHETGALYRTMLLDMEAGITGESAQTTAQTEESTVQTALERGIMQTEQQYLAALEETNREAEQYISSGEMDFSTEYSALGTKQSQSANMSSAVAFDAADTEQSRESSVQTNDESGRTTIDLWVEQYLNALEEETQEPNFTQTELAEIGAALLSAGIMPQGKYFDALGIDKPRARGIQVVMRMALEDSPVRQKAAEIVAQIRAEVDAREKQANIHNGIDSANISMKPKKVNRDASVLEISENKGRIQVDKVVSGHDGTPKQAAPNIVIDHVDNKGNVDARGFYNSFGMKERDLHTTNHGYPKQHDYGEHGEHAHDYEWDDNGKLKNKTTRNLTVEERERNSDIL